MEKAISLKEVWAEFRQRNPKIRIRDAARILGASEAELVATAVGDTVVPLKKAFKELLGEIGSLGKVMALTRNEFCVHERKGRYEQVSFNNHVGLALGPDIDLRLFMNRWKTGFAVREKERQSFQFFDADGTAVHKIYMTADSGPAVYDELVERYRAATVPEPLVSTGWPLMNESALKPGKSSGSGSTSGKANTAGEANASGETNASGESHLAETVIKDFQRAWLELKDTHDFFGLLRKYGLNREKAMHIAPEGHAVSASTEQLTAVFEKASERQLPIMVFTSSPGCVQIHTGPVQRLVRTGPWFNVLDPDFNLHLRLDGIDSVWLVRKPTADGIVTGVEAFDNGGNLIVQLFGKRKPGIPEDSAWCSLTSEVIGGPSEKAAV